MEFKVDSLRGKLFVQGLVQIPVSDLGRDYSG